MCWGMKETEVLVHEFEKYFVVGETDGISVTQGCKEENRLKVKTNR